MGFMQNFTTHSLKKKVRLWRKVEYVAVEK